MVMGKRLAMKSPLLGINKLWAARKGLNSLLLFLIAASALAIVAAICRQGEAVTESSLSREGSFGARRKCDPSSGRWVFDNQSYPLYPERRCSFMSDQLACEKFGRKDLRYQNWRWHPHDCSLPRFNGTKMMERIKGKRLAFVGDSLNRGQWISMLCLLETSAGLAKSPMIFSGSLTTVRFKEYNASVEFYWSPLLVESNSDDPINHRLPERIVRLESIEKHAQHWTNADILIFNSYLWWRRDPKMKVIWGSFESEEKEYEEIAMLTSFKMALKTWAAWLHAHVDPVKTQVFFVTLSPTHQSSREWDLNSEGNCYNQTDPITKEGYWGRGSDRAMMRAVEEAVDQLRESKPELSIAIIDITQLSEYRKDGHPSIYRKQWEPLTPQQLLAPTSFADCIHWCLPGVPDVWNELLYAALFPSPL
ncbi:trichome birefringence-like 34 protein [Nymphaea thermarum]|nr:trichome birefringence-like 34 protein [Nymphaea thermarum]